MAEKKRKTKEKSLSLLMAVFWALIGVGALIIFTMTFPEFRSCMHTYFLFLMGIFFLLGAALLFLSLKQKVEKKLKIFLILTGASALGFFVFSILHNLVYALFMLLFGNDFWTRTGLVDEPLFFLIAVLVCPLGFLVGIVGSIILFVKRSK